MASDAAKKFFDRGLAFFHRNEHEKAADLFKKAVFEEADYPEALYNLASCLAVLGEDEDAFIYLDRASRLNPQCLTWAKEDSEYDNLRNDARFQRIFETNDIIGSPPDEEDQDEEMYGAEEEPEDDFDPDELQSQLGGALVEKTAGGMPKLDDQSAAKTETPTPKSNFPPCANCGGIIEEGRVPKFPILVSMGFIFFGTLITIMLLSAISIIVGLPIIICGFYMFMQNEVEWECLACGARGQKAGQPKNIKKKKTSKVQQAG
jgi:hypothetical protein